MSGGGRGIGLVATLLTLCAAPAAAQPMFSLVAIAVFRPPRRLSTAVVAAQLTCTVIVVYRAATAELQALAVGAVITTLALTVVFVLGVSVWALRRGHPDARPILWGMGLTSLAALLQTNLGAMAGATWSSEGPQILVALGIFCVMVAAFAYVLARRFIRTATALDVSYAKSRRFVPADFLAAIGRAELADVERGDAAEREMTVMFADVRGFTPRAEAQSPDETFAWLNRYLATVEPVIRAHRGFVNQYYGDGIMALFDDADDALGAAVAIQDAVAEADLDAEIGIGLHTGRLVLGTIGGEERLDTGVVGDAVNTAARVEGLTKEHGRAILLSGATRDALAEEHALEEVATVTPKGKSEAITLYGVRG